MKEDKVINKESRRITSTYTLDNGYRVKLSTSHSGNYKVIRSLLSECLYRQELNYAMETHAMFRDYNQQVTSEPVARYSFDKLEAVHAKALEMAAADISALISSGEAGERDGPDTHRDRRARGHRGRGGGCPHGPPTAPESVSDRDLGTPGREHRRHLRLVEADRLAMEREGGRTDAGVHALAQVAHLDVATAPAPDTLRMRVNDALPHDIADVEVLDLRTSPTMFFLTAHDALWVQASLAAGERVATPEPGWASSFRHMMAFAESALDKLENHGNEMVTRDPK